MEGDYRFGVGIWGKSKMGEELEIYRKLNKRNTNRYGSRTQVINHLLSMSRTRKELGIDLGVITNFQQVAQEEI